MTNPDHDNGETEPTPIELQTAMVMLETHRSTSYEPKRWERWRYAEENYAPEWLTESDLDCDPDLCVTVLDFSLQEPEAPEGYRRAYQFSAGEKECPCGDSYRDEEHSPKREDCK